MGRICSDTIGNHTLFRSCWRLLYLLLRLGFALCFERNNVINTIEIGTMFLSFGNAFVFGGLLATLPSEERFEAFRRKLDIDT